MDISFEIFLVFLADRYSVSNSKYLSKYSAARSIFSSSVSLAIYTPSDHEKNF